MGVIILSLEKFFEEGTSMHQLADKIMYDAIDENRNMMIPWYIMACYAYYIQDDPILSDGAFDKLSKRMVDKWEEICHHHKSLLDLESVKAGTLLLPKNQYPTRVKGAVEAVRRLYDDGKDTK